ncbi:hypothetical protein Tco_1344059, partial [Tanacetum coccineum]
TCYTLELMDLVQSQTNRLSTIFHHLSHKLSHELLPFIDLYSGDIVSRNVLTLHIPSPFVIVIVVMFAVVRCSEWPACSWREDGYRNGGNLPRAYIVGNTLRCQDLEWYDALKDSELKE